MDLQTPITQGPRLIKAYARKLEKLDITTLDDLILHFPFRYEDYSLVSPIVHVQPGETITIQGVVTDIQNVYTRSHKTLQKATIQDATGSIEATWFNQPYIPKIIHSQTRIALSGKADVFLNKLVMQSPEYEVIQDALPQLHTGRLVPVYPETKGVSSKWLRRQIFSLMNLLSQYIDEYLPEHIITKHRLMHFPDALMNIHFPKTNESAEIARKRLEFDELFILQLSTLLRKQEWKQAANAPLFSMASFHNKIDQFKHQLPFQLTSAQDRVLKEISNDLTSSTPMNRLLKGDVGSGKTVVAAITMYVAYLNRYQSVLMAPTEILAQQHFTTINNLLSPLGLKIGLATGSKKIGITNHESGIKNKKNLNSKFIIHNSFNVLVGTHAVLSKNIDFERLGLVVIDEQQRFGVRQRGLIRKKGNNPHVLTMTATPIPRTVALTVYGDLDLSVLDEMPIGRQRIKTWLVPPEKRDSAYRWIEKQIRDTSSQAFIICPFIEESENMQSVKAATREVERLKKDVFRNLRLGLLHGRQKTKEKDAVLKDFKDRTFDILVATPVVEVGIDIPNATIIVIETSERFGLAQLHQLRGRVGRSNKQSFCLLFTESTNPQTNLRLKSLETMHSGSELAELDLKIRGAGDIYGTAQHGFRELKIASFSNTELIKKTREEAETMLTSLSQFPRLENKLKAIQQTEVKPD